MNRKGYSLVTALSILVIGVAQVQAQSEGGNPENGQVLYRQHCLRCHGETLEGNGPDARHLIVPPANLRAPAVRAKTDWELLIPIYHGVMFTPMHGWKDRLTYEQIRDILSYIRSVAPFEAVG